MNDTNFFRSGRMISSTKTCQTGHLCVFNANILTRDRGKIWFGDLDLTTDARPERVLEIVEGWADTTWDVGIAFGTVGVRKGGPERSRVRARDPLDGGRAGDAASSCLAYSTGISP